MEEAREYNIDSIVGPTHNYSGLSLGNEAAHLSRGTQSNPRAAAIQGLAKMSFIAELGVPQLVFPSHDRPDIGFLRKLGFRGPDSKVLTAAAQDPQLLAACSSASYMWLANMATVTPSADSVDHKVHFTPANLVTNLHRSIEVEFAAKLLKAVFADPELFTHHAPLPSSAALGDEGAANHIRFSRSHAGRGVHLFVFGRRVYGDDLAAPSRYPARQTYEASTAISRTHRISSNSSVFAQQNPVAVDRGIFHNDVASTGNESLFLYHELAFTNGDDTVDRLRQAYLEINGSGLDVRRVDNDEMTIEEAIGTYFFNSQIITLPDRTMALVAPIESKESASASGVLNRLVQDPSCPIKEVMFVDLNQSMRNGGGPACLRLRVVLKTAESARLRRGVVFTPRLRDDLRKWVCRHYRDRLSANDLVDPQLLDENRIALDELTHILNLGSIYPFQGSEP